MNRIIRIGLMVMLAQTLPAQADILHVRGDVSGVWSADTVIATGNLRIPAGQTLTISSGVQVIFSGFYVFLINGGLEALGNPDDSIHFFATQNPPGWRGLRFVNAAPASHLSYCVIRNGVALGSDDENYGGAIYCYNSHPLISHVTLTQNYASHSGGGIWCKTNSRPIIEDCLIVNNSSAVFGGGMGSWESQPDIERCVIVGNSSGDDGGGLFFNGSYSTVANSILHRNSGVEWGGGICVGWDSQVAVSTCIIDENRGGDGGGVYIYDSELTMVKCLVSHNLAAGGSGVYTHNDGGGIFAGYSAVSYVDLEQSSVVANSALRHGGGAFMGGGCVLTATESLLADNTAGHQGGGISTVNAGAYSLSQISIVHNSAVRQGGGIFSYTSSNPSGQSCLIWLNSTPPISNIGSPHFSYSDIQSGWPGIGNIDQDPVFVDTVQADYRLLWGSPCIDSGHPDSLDPDGTRADMGAFFYDQSSPIRILLTPHELPYLIPEDGGAMDYTLRVFNRDSTSHETVIWCDVTLPDSSGLGPVLGPLTITLGAASGLERVRTQNVPASAPMGVYHYNAYAIVGADTSKDSFMFGKIGG